MWVATAIIGSAIIGGGASIIGSQNAANAQTNAANASIAAQQAQQAQTRADLLPYNTAGQGALSTLQANNYYTAPITMDQATLEKTPGYQFNLTQGLKSTQNSAAARGLGVSGAALKGASAFATGLADNTYQNQFNNANTNNTNAYNRLAGIVNTGETAAAQTGILGQQSANQVSTANTQAGTAQAAAANATGAAVSNAANNIGSFTYNQYKGLYGGALPTQLNPGTINGTNGIFGGSENAIQ